jgi:hypothetical protein
MSSPTIGECLHPWTLPSIKCAAKEFMNLKICPSFRGGGIFMDIIRDLGQGNPQKTLRKFV